MKHVEFFRINTPTIVHEIFEKEVVIIHLDNGNYYTLDESGTQIWKLLNQGATTTAIITELTRVNANNSVDIAKLLTPFLDKLQQEQLIVPCPEPSNDSVTFTPSSELHAATALTLFPAPAIKKYTDMQDLLMLDPIHDVEATGWPNAKSI